MCRPVYVPGKIYKKQFSQQVLCRSCEARARLFKCRKRLTNPFKPSRMCCEARASIYKCQERCRKQLSPQWKFCDAGASLFMSQERSRKRFHHCCRS